ncbi:HAD-like domain-containing protein [Suillus ampliporus]|nr:HAD-like domain-containing protein [Suillus ampliporus]
MSQESPLGEPIVYYGKKFIVLSDWDGTITTQDSNDFLTDNFGMGRENRVTLNQRVRNNEDNFRDAFRKMLESVVENGKEGGKVTHTFEFCKNAVANNIKVDDTFKGFYEFCETNDIPVVIVSSGMEPIIRAVLNRHLASLDGIQIVSNQVKMYDDGHWEIPIPSSRESKAIAPYRNMQPAPIIFFFGDGVSDLSAAQGATCLFVKYKPNGENDLMEYCIKNKIKHRLFESFKEAQDLMKLIIFAETEEEQQNIIAREWPEVA